ncbi:response regulator [Emticicia sp. BO119]|uniref:response regulator n=1 Tax=Emticicia sp. BO119 TaxID=2757768 RepID=UPI0015F02A49|nr:response regulator [Emticicia sp. BO119]MBA4853005.1 response regulator [Emticicia sp. BO119]
MQKTTVFLIDDDIDDQEIFSFILSDAYPQAECVFADDGLYAIQQLQNVSFNPHIIFIDINMPRLNGLEILKEIKKVKRLSDTPVFMYSTSNEKAIVEASKKLGATGFIKKHIDTDIAKQEFQSIIAKLKL